MKTKTILLTLSVMLTVTVLIFQSCKIDNPANENNPSISSIEGVFKYLYPIEGQAIMIDNHFSYVVGPYDSTMFAEAGTYFEKNDTIYNEIIYSSYPELTGYKYKWSVESSKGDTMIFVVYNNEGEITKRWKSLKIN